MKWNNGKWFEDNNKTFKKTINTIANGISVSSLGRKMGGTDLIYKE